MKYANGTPNTRTLKNTKFQYFEEDCICELCLYYREKSKYRKAGCELKTCCCADIRAESANAGWLKRPRGWNKNARSE